MPATMGGMSTTIQISSELGSGSDWGEAPECPMASMFEILGTKTSYLIMREAFYGVMRFEEFVERAGISEPVVAARLRELTAEGVLEKVPYQEPGQRTRSAYQLTEKGSDLLPVLVAMMRWGDRWLFPNGARVELTHAGCGARVRAELRCDAGHAVTVGELELGLNPRRLRRPVAR
jgi:DNA-binding HxlR family transcriptional regulator